MSDDDGKRKTKCSERNNGFNIKLVWIEVIFDVYALWEWLLHSVIGIGKILLQRGGFI